MSDNNITQTIYLKDVCSMEYYRQGEQNPQQVLKNISLEMNKGEIWAILGSSAFELRLLLEIIANARPYQSGSCTLAQRGMMRKKRGILPHVYYIGSTNMLFDNMNVLEYMMFITAKSKEDVIDRQKRIFQQLLDLQLDYLSLSNIRDLTPAERAIITLLAALYTESEIIIWNIARLQYDERGKKALQALCEVIKAEQKTLLFSTFDYETVQAIATHIACLKDGQIIYQGGMLEFIESWDNLAIVMEDARAEALANILKPAFPNIGIYIHGERIELWDQSHDVLLYEKVMQTLCQKQIYPQKIYQHQNNVENAWKEVSVHDL